MIHSRIQSYPLLVLSFSFVFVLLLLHQYPFPEALPDDTQISIDFPKTNDKDSFAFSCVKGVGEQRPGRSRGRPIQFIHLPKAGGTSVQESLGKWATNAGIQVTLHDGDGPTWNTPIQKGLFLGHRGYGFTNRVLNRNPITILALREPVSRIISLFDYLRKNTEKVTLVQMVRKAWQSKTLDEVVESYNNALRTNPESLLPGGSASFSDRTFHRVLQAQLQYICGFECVWYMTGDVKESFEPFKDIPVFEKALENIEKIDCVVILNQLDDLLFQLKAKLDFIPSSFVSFPHDNKVNPEEKSQPSLTTLDLLKEYLQTKSYYLKELKLLQNQELKRLKNV